MPFRACRDRWRDLQLPVICRDLPACDTPKPPHIPCIDTSHLLFHFSSQTRDRHTATSCFRKLRRSLRPPSLTPATYHARLHPTLEKRRLPPISCVLQHRLCRKCTAVPAPASYNTMNPQPPQHSFSRPQDRPLIHNPNHQPTPQQPQHPPFSSFAPNVSQAPVHIPFADPFQRRGDPFMPNPQHQRRASYGIPARDTIGGVQADRAPVPGGWAPQNGRQISVCFESVYPKSLLPRLHRTVDRCGAAITFRSTQVFVRRYLLLGSAR